VSGVETKNTSDQDVPIKARTPSARNPSRLVIGKVMIGKVMIG